MIKPSIVKRFPWLLIVLCLLGSRAVADARQSKNDIAYWRDTYQALTPADDPRVSRAAMIFERLLQVTGRRPDVEPRLYIIKEKSRQRHNPWELTLPIALPKGWIILSQGVLDICYQERTTGDDRLAFILAHEISHQLGGDLWHLRFFQAIEATSRQKPVDPKFLDDLQRGVSMTEHVLARELQADERGMIYAIMAGFDAQSIVTADDRVNFFADWVRALNPSRVTGRSSRQLRPTPQERAAALKTRLRQVVDQTAVFEAGLWWYYAGDYPRAILAFDHFRELYPGREVLHDLAASHHRLALQFYQAWKPEQPAMPLRISMAIEIATRASQIYIENQTQASRGDLAGAQAAEAFRQELEHAIDGYGKVRQLDASYIPAALNLSSALILQSLHGHEADRQSGLASAIATLSQALKSNPQDAKIHTNLGVAYFYDGQRERAKTCLKKALDLSPNDDDATYNLTYISDIESRQGSVKRTSRVDKPFTTGSVSVERIQELTIGDVLPSQGQARLQSRFKLGGRTFTLATYTTPIKTLTQNSEVLMVMALPGYPGRSANGIGIGSRDRDVQAAYGDPVRRLATTQGHTWSYDQQRIAFQLEDARVVSWIIY